MTDTLNDSERRRERRHEVVLDRTVEALIQRGSDESEETVAGELLDLSQGGMQVCLPIYLKFSEVIGVRIVVPEADVEFDVTAKVCWIRPTEDNKCLVGCSFTPKISDAPVERLAAFGVINRRRHFRKASRIAAVARWGLDAEASSVQILDYSEGGFCMVSDRPSTVGATVSVDVDAPDGEAAPISARVCWQVERDGRYFLGCSTKSVYDYQRLHDLCSKTTAGVVPVPFIVATCLFAFFGSTLVGLKAIDCWPGSPMETLSVAAEFNTVAATRLSDTNIATTGETTNVNPPESTESDKNTAAIENMIDVGPITAQEAVPERTVATADKLDTPPQVRPANTSISSIDEPVSVDQVPPPSSRMNQDAALVTKKHVETQLAPQVADSDQIKAAPQAISVPPQVAKTDQIKAAPQAISEPLVDITKAKEAFVVGDRFYRNSHFDKARSAFQTAVKYDSQNALHYYLLAMTHYQLRQFQEAESAVQNAIRLEKEWPIENWGSRLSRYQGRARLWVEQLRAAVPDGIHD